jgi:hypothetical protein
MLQLIAAGALPGTPRPLDPNWWPVARAVAERIQQQNSIQLYRDRLYHKLAHLRDFHPSEEAWSELWNECNQLRTQITNLVLPWDIRTVLSPAQQTEALVQQYRTEIGDPNDPAYSAEIERLLHYWDTGEILPAEPAETT